MTGVKHIFITGTDTGVGKTIVSAILTAGLEATYWKPIQCGLRERTDSEIVRDATGLSEVHFIEETYKLSQPLSPHAAAEHDQVRIDLSHFHIPEEVLASNLIVEGAGGVMVPLNENEFMIDLMKRLNMPVILVARSSLGTINHTILSLNALQSHGLEVLGVVMNGPKNLSNKEALEKYGNIRVLAEIEPIDDINTIDMSCFYRKVFPGGIFI
jgi:dethiobiotin synthase